MHRIPALFRHNRLLFEPAVALAFLLTWGLVSAVIGGRNDASVILLLAIAIGMARISPGWALTAGAIGLAQFMAESISGSSLTGWPLLITGVIVFFASSAYGNTASRWVGLVGAIVVTAVVSSLLLTSLGMPGYVFGSWTESSVVRAIGAGVLFLGRVQVVAAVLCGSWALGLITRSRAARRIAHAGVESWIMLRDNEAPDRVVMRPSRFVRELRQTDFAIDVMIAVGFIAFDVMSYGTTSVPGSFVVLALAGALAVRRLSPALSLALAWLAALTQMATHLDILGADFAILIVLYATAAYGGRIVKWVGLASVGIGAVCAAGYLLMRNGAYTPSAPLDVAGFTLQFVGYFVASAAVLGLSWTLGLLTRTWQSARANKRLEVQAVQEGLAAQRSVIVEQERNRIARDMHDVVAHSLAVVIAQADGARYARATDPGAVDTALTTISTTAREALGDVRLLLAQLRQDEVAGPQPMLVDLDRLIAQMRSAGLSINWTVTGEPLALGSGAQLALYRIIQEALTNALRHGDPQREVRLSLSWDSLGVVVTVSNEIKVRGSDEPGAAESVGHGLPGMRERALLAGGALHTDTQDGRFTVTARIPAGWKVTA
ncbi:sensor histidine kinase [Leifsonia sp. A12D58]|uniref:sensor histidine kinase n=1 Tax=Leifsonia sp. A12D58 TaxID=3397674 RepID=UPI0039DF684C